MPGLLIVRPAYNELWVNNYVAPPAMIGAFAGNEEIDVQWDVSPTASTYNVYRSEVMGGPYTLIASGVTVPTYLDTGLDNGTTYYYVVTSNKNGEESEYSTEVSATPAPVIFTLLAGGAGGAATRSIDALTWATIASFGSDVQGIIRLGTDWYAATFDTKGWSSVDGGLSFTWVGSIPSAPTHLRTDGVDLFVTSNSVAGRYYRTPDMANVPGFTTFDIPGFTAIISTMHWNATLAMWLATGNVGQAKTSTDGETWSAPVTAPTTVYSLGSFGATWLAGGTGVAGIQTSTNLAGAWTNRLDTGAESIRGFADDGTTLVAVGTAGIIYTSADGGDTWTARVSGVATDLYAAVWDDAADLFVVVGAAGVILTSPTGVTWTPQASGTGSSLIVVTI